MLVERAGRRMQVAVTLRSTTGTTKTPTAMATSNTPGVPQALGRVTDRHGGRLRGPGTGNEGILRGRSTPLSPEIMSATRDGGGGGCFA